MAGAPPNVTAAVLLRRSRLRGDPATRPLTVLLAEGLGANRMLAAQRLEAAGHRCLPAATWQEAYGLLTREPVDALLLDLACPGARRLEAVRLLRSWPPPLGELAVVAIAGRQEPGEAEACREAGVDRLLIRPLEDAPLEAALRAAVLARTPPDPLDRARRAALRAVLDPEALAEEDDAAMHQAAIRLHTLRHVPGQEALREAAGAVAAALEGIGAALAAAAARALEAAPDRRPVLLPPLFSALVATRVALREEARQAKATPPPPQG